MGPLVSGLEYTVNGAHRKEKSCHMSFWRHTTKRMFVMCFSSGSRHRASSSCAQHIALDEDFGTQHYSYVFLQCSAKSNKVLVLIGNPGQYLVPSFWSKWHVI